MSKKYLHEKKKYSTVCVLQLIKSLISLSGTNIHTWQMNILIEFNDKRKTSRLIDKEHIRSTKSRMRVCK